MDIHARDRMGIHPRDAIFVPAHARSEVTSTDGAHGGTRRVYQCSVWWYHSFVLTERMVVPGDG
eukprot:1008438-Rhodomonas_salina.4